MNRFNSPSFAKGANRDQIRMCEKELNIPLEEFVGIVLKAMQEISANLGL
jgi:predicted hydrolase (HD superfamily)